MLSDQDSLLSSSEIRSPLLPSWPVGDGIAALVRTHDWTETPLGSIVQWPQSLKTAVDIILGCEFSMIVLWGRELIQIYNEGYREIMAEKHPAGLGQATRKCWPEVWHINEPIYQRVWAGESVTLTDQLFPITRCGYREDAWFTLCYSPVRDELGQVGGVLVTVFETTGRLRAEAEQRRTGEALRASEERQNFLLRLSDALRPLTDPDEIQFTAVRLLGEHLGASRVGYAEDQGDGEAVVVTRNYANGVLGLEGTYRYEDYGLALLQDLQAGRSVIRPDIAHDPTLSEEDKQSHNRLHVGAMVNIPLIKADRLVAILFLHYSQAHAFTAPELTLLEDVAERTWASVKRAQAEAALGNNEARFRAFIHATSDVVYTMSPDWTQMRQLSGKVFLADTTEPSTTWLERYIPQETQIPVLQAIQEAVSHKRVFDLEHSVLRQDGTVGWTRSRAVPILDEDGKIIDWIGAATDITAIRQHTEALRRALAERDALLKEVHHRVKNNLLLVDSLLSLQAGALADTRACELLTETSNRIHAIAQIHRLLYASTDLTSVDVKAFVNVLSCTLPKIFNIDTNRVRTVIGPERLFLNLRRAIPLGLILNELISNALQHAFPNGRAGIVTVELSSDEEGATVRVSDNGIGLPEVLPSTSLGLELVHLLTNQLQGSVQFQSSSGSQVSIRFPLTLQESEEPAPPPGFDAPEPAE